jgi:hypothetical protein
LLRTEGWEVIRRVGSVGRARSELSSAELFLEITQLAQSALSAAFLVGRRWGWSRRALEGRVCRRPEPDPTDVEILLEAVQLEEIGEFEGSHIPARVADFPLQVANDLNQVVHGEAGVPELIPKPLPVKTQREVLTGEAAIGLVQLCDLRGDGWSWAVHGFMERSAPPRA